MRSLWGVSRKVRQRILDCGNLFSPDLHGFLPDSVGDMLATDQVDFLFTELAIADAFGFFDA